MRSAIAAALFATITALLAVSEPAITMAQDKKAVQPKFDPPKATKPDAATLNQIAEKTEALRTAVAALKEKKTAPDVLIEVEIYLKAAENIVRFEEWYAANSGKWALTTLDQGLARAKQAEGGNAVWRNAPGKWVVRAYRSEIDGSIQPYAVLLPHDYGKDPKKKWRVDVVLHGRDAALTEAKFIATHAGNAPKDLKYVQLEVYGRGNNAYRWAGETDVFEAMWAFDTPEGKWKPSGVIDRNRIVLRGFSMGGAGTWHIGLHHPFRYCVIGPGAGFTTTHGYVGNLPKELPDYVEKCLHIYDAVDYAENAFNVPVVAYSGEKDAQKKAADNIEAALKSFKEPVKFTHLVAPGLEHQMPKEWQDKAETEYEKYASEGLTAPNRVRFVTHTLQYANFGWGYISGLGEHYKPALVDGTSAPGKLTLVTENVTELDILASRVPHAFTNEIVIDGQKLSPNKEDKKLKGDWGDNPFFGQTLVKREGKWTVLDPAASRARPAEFAERPRKTGSVHGPIDDAFRNAFAVIGPTGAGWHDGPSRFVSADLERFAKLWEKYFRGTLLKVELADLDRRDLSKSRHLVLFGDPQSNPLIAKMLPKLPITWTKEKLIVNGVEYDMKTHVPVLIYPNPLDGNKGYVVLNSGHTFKEADLKGTNALLYPRLGDWAVIKPTPTDKDPAAYEVVAAGLFDENWQFPKKK